MEWQRSVPKVRLYSMGWNQLNQELSALNVERSLTPLTRAYVRRLPVLNVSPKAERKERTSDDCRTMPVPTFAFACVCVPFCRDITLILLILLDISVLGYAGPLDL